MGEVWESIPKWGCNSTPTADELKPRNCRDLTIGGADGPGERQRDAQERLHLGRSGRGLSW